MARSWSRTDGKTTTDRGYGSSWRKLRKRILERDCYLCQCPECKGQRLIAHEVDHIKPKAQGGTDDPTNLRAVNKDCHERLTLEQQGKRSKPLIGLDGWPV